MSSVNHIFMGEILSWVLLASHGFEYDHYLLQGEWKSPKFRWPDLRAGVWGVSLDAGRGVGHKSGPVPSCSPVGWLAQIDPLIDQQLGGWAPREANGRGRVHRVIDNDRWCHKASGGKILTIWRRAVWKPMAAQKPQS